MNKKQRNRKLVTQNNRNRLVNRRYSSTIKTFSKLIAKKVKVFHLESVEETKNKLKVETKLLVNRTYSLLDKAVKKNVFHKNTAARRKMKINKLAAI